MSYRTRWTILMTIGGLAVAAVVWVITDNFWWAVAGLLGAGIVFNAIFNPGARSHR